ncbi:MAG: rRNA (guanosine2251-2-O)-methyltransferase [Gaiellaceae bacterium]|jgi:23S rRNA (guanosine2251-2'-O)-methyltransferase|nr:rRNA (guanosine2251-2-O)-methyltransferase [Gaiellaceae bacterium]MDX6492572.1 rRNA (guanosine2251-2-O)-methyltransferase [Gaiellaceae bacterium]
MGGRTDARRRDGLIVLEGAVSVGAALEGGRRPVERILIRADKWEKSGKLRALARRTETRVERATAEQIDVVATGRTHGGILAEVGPLRHASASDLARGDRPFVAMLDGIEDPYNFGYAIRSLYAAGADGLVVRPRDWGESEATIVKASAGAFDLLPIAEVENAEAAADLFAERGLAVACTAKRDATPIYDADLSGPLFLLVGGERRGITREFLSRADLVLEIPYRRRFSLSLGTVAAVSVLAFEVMRQRRSAVPPVA